MCGTAEHDELRAAAADAILVAIPPEATTSVPPLLTAVPVGLPPARSISVPPLLTIVNVAAHRRPRYSVPPPLTVVAEAKPPTASSVPPRGGRAYRVDRGATRRNRLDPATQSMVQDSVPPARTISVPPG